MCLSLNTYSLRGIVENVSPTLKIYGMLLLSVITLLCAGTQDMFISWGHSVARVH